MDINFIFYDEKKRTNSGYPEYSVSFTQKEINKLIALKYKRRLIQKIIYHHHEI
jgi:hypothetical protein